VNFLANFSGASIAEFDKETDKVTDKDGSKNVQASACNPAWDATRFSPGWLRLTYLI